MPSSSPTARPSIRVGCSICVVVTSKETRYGSRLFQTIRETLPMPSPPSPGRNSVASSTPRHQLGQAAWSWIASQTGSRGDSSSQVVRKAYSAIAPSLRPGHPPGSVVVRGLAVAQVGVGRLDDLGEADHRHLV